MGNSRFLDTLDRVNLWLIRATDESTGLTEVLQTTVDRRP